MEAGLAGRIDALLPQTQCGKCGYDACLPYARAIAANRADINRCPPGGAATIRALAALLGRDPKPLDPRCGREQPPRVAVIDEESCIGCVKCIRACPVDAIIGAPKRMHTVIPQECTGCELCLPPCPVDCIAMVETAPPAGDEARRAVAARARARYLARRRRLERQRQPAAPPSAASDLEARRAFIREAVERTRARRRRTEKGGNR
jgi:electron transport complex protein RnfB